MIRSFRPFLVLGRVSNLPTVWSNCLAAWFLAGGSKLHGLPYLFSGATCLYVAGMFLNDAFDADFDRQHRIERPIPSGAVRPTTVWTIGFALLVCGTALLFLVNYSAGCFGLLLALTILLYDAIHKRTNFSPVLMALCRFWLYLVAGSAAAQGLSDRVIWEGAALASYIIGLSYLARRESFPGPLRHWPLLFLAAPVLLALLYFSREHNEGTLMLSLVLVLWVVRCLRSTLWSIEKNIGRTVSGLLAGIVLVDWLAVAAAPRELGFAFIALFLVALLFQRYIPPT